MNRILLLVLFLIFLSPAVTAQDKQRSMVSRGSALYSLLDSAQNSLNSPQKAFDLLEKALIMSIREKDRQAEGISYTLLGMVNFQLSQPDLALEYYRKAASLFQAVGDRRQLRDVWVKMGDASNASGEYEAALSWYRKFLDNETDQGKRIEANYKLAGVYDKMGRQEQAMRLWNEILNAERLRNNKKGMIAAQNQIGKILVETDREEKALETYRQSAEIAEEIESNEDLANTLQEQGAALRKSRRYDDELKVREQLLDMADADIPAQAVENLEIGEIYLQKKESEKAIPYLQRSIDLSEATGNLEGKGEALRTLSEAYKEQQAYDKALFAYQEYANTVDEMHRRKEEEIKNSLQQTATLNRKLERMDLIEKELQLSQKTVDLLRQEQLVNQKELKAQRIFTYSLTSVLFIFMAASVFIYRSGVQKRKANQMLALRSLRSQMNPHFIYNSLNSVNNHISRNDEKAANKYLSDFSRLMRAVMENSKHDFVPLSSEIEALKLYLFLEHARFHDKFEYEFEVDQDIETDAYLIPPMLIQPFVENAIWHGLRYRKTKGLLKVKINKANGRLEALVEDNGIGRKRSQETKTSHQKEHKSTGLLNIRSRIELINRLFTTRLEARIEDLDAENKTGTRVIIIIPPKNALDHA